VSGWAEAYGIVFLIFATFQLILLGGAVFMLCDALGTRWVWRTLRIRGVSRAVAVPVAVVVAIAGFFGLSPLYGMALLLRALAGRHNRRSTSDTPPNPAPSA
jgi:hypothetical protein